MNYNQSEVSLAIQLPGLHSVHGQYSHYHNVNRDGKEINGVKLEKAPVYCKAYKNVKLGNEFVNGALAEPPQSMKTMRVSVWKQIPQRKRIAIHVNAYVKAIHPEHRGYTMEIF